MRCFVCNKYCEPLAASGGGHYQLPIVYVSPARAKEWAELYGESEPGDIVQCHLGTCGKELDARFEAWKPKVFP